jgi:3-oxoacyl-[acyl-carrier protein] reductase
VIPILRYDRKTVISYLYKYDREFDMASKLKGRLEGRVAIVTGASRGIGRATAQALAREGAKVAVNFHREKSKAEEVVNDINKHGGSAMLFQADVSDRIAVEGMVTKTFEEFGNIDVLVNNAGVFMGGGSLLEFNEEEYDPMWRVNVKGVLNCTRAVAPYMIERSYGKVVNISSVAGIGTASPDDYLYSTTKAAVNILTKRLALELGQHGINVNAIAPGLIWTDMGMDSRSREEQERRIELYTRISMLQRIGKPEEIANVILFLSSDEASFITGQVITVDGGRTNFITNSR